MKEEIQEILDKARSSIEAADVLEIQGYHDFAISRAYYGMFYTAEALLLYKGLSFSSHSAVIAAFGKEYARSGDFDPRFHRWLIDAQDYRNLGDYNFSPSVTHEQVHEVMAWAMEFLSTAERYLASR